MTYDAASEVGVVPTVAWEDGVVVMIDQRRLPAEQVLLRCRTHPEVAQAAAGLEVLPLDGQRFVEERGTEQRAALRREGVEPAAHPLDRPEEVDRSGPRGGERRAHVGPLGPQSCFLAPGDAGAEGEAKSGGDPDRGGPADRHVLDGGRHLVVVAAAQEDLLGGQAPLVDHHHDAVLPRHRRDHSRLRKQHMSSRGTPVCPVPRDPPAPSVPWSRCITRARRDRALECRRS